MNYDDQLDKSAALRIEYLSRKPYRDIRKLFSKEDIWGLSCRSFIIIYLLSANNERSTQNIYCMDAEFEHIKKTLKQQLLSDDINAQNIIDYLKAELKQFQSPDLLQDASKTLTLIKSICPQLLWY